MDVSLTSKGGQLPPVHPDYDGEDDVEERSSIADIFYGKAVLPHETYICEENGYKGSVDIMVGHPALLEDIITEHDKASGKIETAIINRLAEFLHMEEMGEVYDLIILDTGPSRSPIFNGALHAATHGVIPFELEEKSIQGINAMIQAVTSENFSRKKEDELKLLGLVPNKVRNTSLHTKTMEELREKLPKHMPAKDIYLPLSTKFPERDVKGINPKSIYQISNSHLANIKSRVVSSWIIDKLFPASPRGTSQVEELATHE
jgi:chromosome partitioning protein